MNDDDGVSDRPTAADSVMEHVAYGRVCAIYGGQVGGYIGVHNEFSVHVGIFW